MARYVGTVRSNRPAREVFEDLADFTSVAQWDPGVASCTHTGGKKGEVGCRFRVVQDTTGPDITIDYAIEEIEHPRRVVLRGTNAWLVSIDVIVVEPTPAGCEVTYDATIKLKGPLALFDPLMSLGLKRIGAKAKKGLTDHVNA
ncbi:SRPBCC family protein [Patulibacter sp.]|uniref:SRPBCC family protein n=1 Tax=Patulibacter sp. TaxID=1912859 RepID=UPI00271724E7|nr:SRPBCC family protein [Patulibacter sp.]MDO9407349.1 SRPBCC family protein [Patulibacter sp.]